MSKRNNLFMTEFAAMSVDTLTRAARPLSASEFARRMWPRGQQTAISFSVPSIKGTIALRRLEKSGYVYQLKSSLVPRRWAATELGILSLSNYFAEYGDNHGTGYRYASYR